MENESKLKTALVLSAGGLFGAYQAGAWMHLSRFFRPDLVVGASIGAINGWLISGDCPRDLESVWLDPSIGSIIQLIPRPGVFRGYFDPTPLDREVRKIHGQCRPVTPFWLVVEEVPSFRTRLIPAASVTPEHLLATCSIYGFYPTVRINGKRYTDGGLFGALPLWAAAEQGATRIIGIDCMPRNMPWQMNAVISTLHRFGPRRPLPADVRILRPSRPLGEARTAMAYDPSRIREWIALGKRDAEQAFPDGVL